MSLCFGLQKRSIPPACMTLTVNTCSWQQWTLLKSRHPQMWPVIWNSLAPRHEPPWPVLYNLEGKILCFLGHRESDLIWLHTSSARVLFSLDQWLCRSIGILTDCLSTVEFSQNKYPLATSFIESPAHVCSTNRPHWDGIPVFTSASSKAPARRTNTSTKMF